MGKKNKKKKQPKENHSVYTDGSCTANPGGQGSFASIFVENNQDYYHIGQPYKTTNSPRMEIMGVLAALRFITEEQSHLNHRYDFYSDSEYVVRTINSWMYGWAKIGWDKCEKKNTDLWKQIHSLWDKKKFTISWIKGHNGNKWNEMADSICLELIREAQDGEIEWLEDYGYINRKPEQMDFNVILPCTEYYGWVISEIPSAILRYLYFHYNWSPAEIKVKNMIGLRLSLSPDFAPPVAEVDKSRQKALKYRSERINK